MLPRKQRIPKALSREVFARGAGVSSANFLIKTASSPDSPGSPTRFAVSISKKVAPTAVARNRARRRVYSAIRDIISARLFTLKNGLLVAITVKKGGENLGFKEIEKEITSLLKRAAVI